MRCCAHAAVGDAVQVAVVGDEAENAVAGLLDPPFGEADELDVVIVEVQLLLVQARACNPPAGRESTGCGSCAEVGIRADCRGPP